MSNKICGICGENKPVSQFNRRRKNTEYYNSWCKECTIAYQRDGQYRRKFGISTEIYEKMLEEQGGVCDICKRPPKNNRLSVDHDHDTGAIRGLLCPPCNRSIEWHIYLNGNINKYMEKNYGKNYII